MKTPSSHSGNPAGAEPISAKFIAPIVMFAGTHVDHGLLKEHWGYVLDVAGLHVGECEKIVDWGLTPLIRTVELPPGCPDVDNALYGPACGDEPIDDSEVLYECRGDRPWADRLVMRPKRPSRLLTIIAVPEFRDVPEKGKRLVCFTAYGGPMAPQHPDDPSNKDREGALKFWAEHALTRGL